MKAIRFQLAPLGSASKVTQDTVQAQLTDAQNPPKSFVDVPCVNINCRQSSAD